MRARPVVQGFHLGTGKPGVFFLSGQRSHSFDVATIAVGLFLLLAGTGCKEKEKAPPPRPT